MIVVTVNPEYAFITGPSFSASHGRKERLMERRINKDFQIGVVEGVVKDIISNEAGTKNIFNKIAKAIGRRESKRKDWNALVRSDSTMHDPIGNANEAQRRKLQQDIRKLVRFSELNLRM